MHGFPVLICSRKATWIGMPCTVWVWKSFSDEGNMEKKQQRKYKWEIESGNKVRKKPVVWLLLQSVTVKILLQQLYWVPFTERNSEGSVLQHIYVYVHQHVTGTCTSHTEAHIDGHKVKISKFLCNLNSDSFNMNGAWLPVPASAVFKHSLCCALLATHVISLWKLSLSGE